ncbi:MAG: ribonuclease HII [Defluviitaleaceae bacterium]|nr:ribonuclease HII [Defluviitaleaceae bacterium]
MKTAPSDIENKFYADGFAAIAGVDEVGRGPLAGPVVACAVILPAGLVIEGVYDSKRVSEKRRENLAEIIKKSAISYAFSIIEPAEIDRINILQATMTAMGNAVDGLLSPPDVILVDGTSRPSFSETKEVLCIPKGDSASHIIAAASILAKVERDAIMQRLHDQYPQYAWSSNKGYGTAAHIAAIKEHGLCPAHRRSFCKGFL